MISKKLILMLWISGLALTLSAQEEYNDIRKGNQAYKAEKYTEAEISYRRALQKKPRSFEAAYNLGNSLFKQEKYAEALEQYQSVIPTDKISKEKLAAALHNTGNALLMQEQIAESISAYKNALKINPKDDETRYNLALAQHLLQNPPPEDQDQNQERKQEDPEEQKQNQQDDSQQKEEEQPSNMPQDKAEQILDALMQDEDDTMEKAKQQPKGRKAKVEKDW